LKGLRISEKDCEKFLERFLRERERQEKEYHLRSLMVLARLHKSLMQSEQEEKEQKDSSEK
jgi:hypothetical protein